MRQGRSLRMTFFKVFATTAATTLCTRSRDTKGKNITTYTATTIATRVSVVLQYQTNIGSSHGSTSAEKIIPNNANTCSIECNLELRTNDDKQTRQRETLPMAVCTETMVKVQQSPVHYAS